MFEDLLKAFAVVGRFSWVNVTAGEESGGPLLASVIHTIVGVNSLRQRHRAKKGPTVAILLNRELS